jgi:hypothetical protein
VFRHAYQNAQTEDERRRLHGKYLETLRFVNSKKLTTNHKKLSQTTFDNERQDPLNFKN